MHLVVGLGNPGERYARTRHNLAWAVLDELAARHAAADAPGHATFHARRIALAEHAVELLQPLTFMNLSGAALAAWRARHELEPGGLLVVADDVYLPFGTLRLRARGSSGGHRGLEGIEAELGSRNYARLRIGVGAAESSAALREHVLERFEAQEEAAVDEVLERAADAAEVWVRDGTAAAMNQFNRRVRKEDSTQ